MRCASCALRGFCITSEVRHQMTDQYTLPRPLLFLVAALTLAWGFNWPMMKLALAELPVWSFRALCIAAGSAGLFAIARAKGLRIRVPAGQWKRLMFSSLFNVTGWNLLIGYGVTMLPAGRSAILAYTMPLWTVMLSALFLHETFSIRKTTGVILGTGAMAMLLAAEFSQMRAAPTGALLIIGAALSWAAGTVIIKRFPTTLPTTSFVAWQLALGGLPIVIGALILERQDWQPVSQTATAALLYNMLIASLFCHWAWFKIATNAPASIAALSTLMIPVVGVFSGMLVLGEQPQWQEYLALMLVTLALATVLVPARSTAWISPGASLRKPP
jgi:drug/metabolite transporter (DMT)-like permease